MFSEPDGADLRIDIHGTGFLGGGPPYPNLSAYAGVAFWSRGQSASGSLLVAIQDDTVAAGHAYSQARGSDQPWFEHPTVLTPEWRRHILLFDDFHQPGLTVPLNTQAVWSLHMLAGLEGGGGDVWIDDLALLCRGACPETPWPVVMSAAGLDDASLTWTPASAASPDSGCGVLSALSMAPLSDLRADPLEKTILRVRIPAAVPPSVPLWAWSIQNAVSGAKLTPVAVDPGWTTVAVPLTAAGDFTIGAHTHYPGTAVCGVQAAVTVR
jgi:hypothetical protein